MKNQPIALCITVAVLALASGPSMAADDVDNAGDLTANAAFTNNYLWRGLTQTLNDAAISGGIDYAADGGFYIGTWVSNVKFGDSDPFSYENDLYFGYSGGDNVTYDIGYIYYNYDSAADVDFGEIYGTIGVGGFGASLYVLTNTQIKEGPGQDLGAGSAMYLSVDYSIDLTDDVSVGLHAGHYSGEDFNAVFNGTDEYTDYNVSLSKGGFTFLVSDTDLPTGIAGDPYDNGSPKFVVSYAMDIDF
jgi:uncharacterized protein (TIGR02001 family)